MVSTTKTAVRGGGLLYFIVELYNQVSGILGHKLQAAVPVL